MKQRRDREPSRLIRALGLYVVLLVDLILFFSQASERAGILTILSVGSTMSLNLRLCQLGLRLVDVGGEGDCFFRAVSHQLHGDPNHHLLIRQAGV